MSRRISQSSTVSRATGRRAGAATLAAALTGWATPAAAQEIELKNDGLVSGATAAVQVGFVNGEIGAATFIVDPALFPIRVLRVQIFWKSLLGGAPVSVQDAILIYEGARSDLRQIFESDPLQLTDGFLNEFDISSEDIVIENPPPDNAFTVGMRFLDAPDGDLSKPSLVSDTDGCQPGLNPLFAIPGGWTDLCAFPASGDFVIRVIVESLGGCYADCDESGELDFFDFLCFQNQFAAGGSDADCDESGALDFFDFLCFQNEFAAGCP